MAASTGHAETLSPRIAWAAPGNGTSVTFMTVGFPLVDPVGPASDGLPEAVAYIAARIAPRAAEADEFGVRREAFVGLAEAGLHGRPLEPAADQRELAELLAGADASTWFCWTQHQGPVQALIRASQAGVRHRLLQDATSGRLLFGVAFAHLRRPGPPNPVARTSGSGWVVDGTLDWITGWDIAEWFMLMVQIEGTNRCLAAVLPAGRGMVAGAVRGLLPGPPLRLLAMSGTHTRPIRLEGVHLHEEDVLYIEDIDSWRRPDALKAANANPGAFGIARGALADLELHLQQRPDAELGEWLADLIAQVRECRRHAYLLADEIPDMNDPQAEQDLLQERRRARAQSLRLAQQTTTAVIVAKSGGSMAAGSAAQRRAREALFMHVQAQTAEAGRAYAQLARQGWQPDVDLAATRWAYS